MSQSLAVPDRAQTFGEEIANSISHGIGSLAAVVAAPVLIIAAAQRGGAAVIVGASIFAFTMVLLYTTSAIYHGLRENKAKGVFQTLDRSAIFLLIAGTYTPFTLGVLRGGWGWTLFGLVWGIAIAGVVLESIGSMRYKQLATTLYLAMGWLIIIAIKPLWLNLPGWGLIWLAAGGVAYTLGVPFYVTKRFRYAHLVWHLFVIAGTAFHFIAVLRYAA